MDTKNIERYLNSFGKQVVNRAKGNLQKAKGGGTALEGSIKFEVVPDGDGFSVKFYMADYGTFIDKGVSGNKKKQSFKDYLGKIISSPYKYTTKQPPPNILAKWISKKGMKGRDKKTGRFISHMSLAFIIGRKIKRDGIKSLAFFQKPLGLGLKQFGQELLGNVKEDIINNLTTVN
jgi:carbon monoxide dehydrogenase subunit G|tara:strand:- start:1043 stop:1570 length:528 start_codon:yes stop_codon:yes gene_type:complete